MRILFVFFVFLSGCVSTPDNTLRWSNSSVAKYATYMDTPLDEVAIDGAGSIVHAENQALQTSIIQSLKSITLPGSMPLVTEVRSLGGGEFEIKTTSTTPVFDSKPANREEEIERKFLMNMAGSLQLLGTVDESGNILSYYTAHKQKNLISLFFKLPSGAVGLGDTWPLPVNLIELGNGYRVSKNQHTNYAKIVSITEDQILGRVANVFYYVNEDLEGSYFLKETGDPPPIDFKVMATYVGFAEFLLDKGVWNSYTAKLTFSGSGGLPLNSSKIHALRWIAE